MTVLVLKETRWNLVRILVERLREATGDFAFGDAFVSLSNEEAAGLARDPAVMESIADVLGCKRSDSKVNLKLGLQLSFRRRAEDARRPATALQTAEKREPLPFVLVIDSVAVWLRRYIIALEGRACVLAALSLKGGEGTFYRYPNISAVVVSARDGSGNNPGVPILVRKMRSSFRGPIIATGGSVKYYEVLADAGCSHHMLKRSVPALLEKILDL